MRYNILHGYIEVYKGCIYLVFKHYQIIHICTMQGGEGEDVQKRKHIVLEFISKQLIQSSEKLMLPTMTALA